LERIVHSQFLLDLFPLRPLFLDYWILETIFLKSFIELILADAFSSPVPGVCIAPLPVIGLTECFGSTGVPLLMRARTEVTFLDPFLIVLDLDLSAAPPVTLTLPLDPP